MKWQLVAIGALLVGLCIVCATFLAVRGVISGTATAGFIGAVIGLFNGWFIPPPAEKKDES